jgi:hypothetical protein
VKEKEMNNEPIIMKLINSTFTENDTDVLIDKVYRENQEYQKNRTTDEERESILGNLLDIFLTRRDSLINSERIDSVRKLKDELEYESMRKYEIQNRLQREGKHDKLFRKFMNSYLTTIVLDNKMEMKK